MNDEPPNQHVIEILNQHPDHRVNERLLRTCITETLSRFERPVARVVITVLCAEDMSRLHHRYLGRAEPTDVLAFDLADDSETGTPLEGDIAICADLALERSRQQGHTCEAELALYAVHGLLHLLGFNDEHTEASTEMHRMEDEILSTVGLGRVYGG